MSNLLLGCHELAHAFLSSPLLDYQLFTSLGRDQQYHFAVSPQGCLNFLVLYHNLV